MSNGTILNYNFLSNHRATISFTKDGLKEFEFNIKKFSIPSIEAEPAKHPGPFITRAVPGDHPVYGKLTVSLLVDENLKAWLAMHNWMRELYFPESFTEYNPSQGDIPPEEASVTIYSSKNNPLFRFKFYEVFPIEVGQLDFTAEEGDDIDMQLDVVFNILYYDVQSLKNETG